MNRYTCKDMGLSCSFVVKNETLDELTKKALAHVIDLYANDFNSFQSLEEVMRMNKALARSVRVVPA